MDHLLTTLGTLFFLFLVLAAATEVILEMFRGVLERFNLTWVRSRISLDEALKASAEFATDNSTLSTKLEGVQAAANQLGKSTLHISQKISKLRTNLAGLTPASSKDAIAAELAQVADQVKSELEKHERLKVWILRSIAAVIGCVLVGQSEFHVFRILTDSPDAKAFLGTLTKLQEPWINIFIGGFAAAAGSSYWHDQLDRIRRLKTVVSEIK